ncbi:MAG: hypothetical protein ACLP53_29850 [Isosphaeraceae bacterium]
MGFRGGFEFASYREVATAPSNEDDAWLLICTVAERQIDRLEKLLEFHKAIEAEEASERDDLAALDTSAAFERHRRYRSALHRELMKLMDALRKARGEACEDGVASEDAVVSGQWSVASEFGEIGDATPPMTSDDGVAFNPKSAIQNPKSEEWSVASEFGEIGDATSPMTSDVGVAFNPKSAIQNPKSEILLHEERDATDGAAAAKAPEKVPNEANSGSTQSSMPIDVQLFAIDPQGGKRSQSAAGRTVGLDAWKDPFEPIAPGSGSKEGARGRKSIE